MLPQNSYPLFNYDLHCIGHPVYLFAKSGNSGRRPHTERQSPTSVRVYNTDQNI